MNLHQFNDFCQGAVDQGVLFYYAGEVSQNVIGTMSDSLKQRLDAAGASGTARRKIFSVFIEMAQNIVHYASLGDGQQSKVGALAVGKGEDGKFYVLCGNPVPIEHVERIKGKVDPLRSMSVDEIKAAYKEQLRNDEHDKDQVSRGAGLGFLTVAREASEPIEYQIVYRSDNAQFAEFYLRAAF